MRWGRIDEVLALGLLLDRTYAEVAAAAARPRLLDREFLIGQFDLWDNHLLPAVEAAAAPLHRRRSAARAVWRLLGFRAEAPHRRWMAEHLDGCGLDPDSMLGAGSTADLPYAGRDGLPRPVEQPLTREASDLLLADYDLAGGAVVGARMEVGVADPAAVHGRLMLSASRRYTRAAGLAPTLCFQAPEATEFAMVHAEPELLRLSGPPAIAVGTATSSITVPAAGSKVRLDGRGLAFCPDDDLWHKSAAAAAAKVGAREPAPELRAVRPVPAGPVDQLSVLQVMILVQLRMMRHPDKLRRWELASAGALCAGLGAELFRLTPAALRTRAAARRLRTMVATDDPLCRALLRQTGRHLRLEVPGGPGQAPPAPGRITVGTAARLLDGLDATGGRLRFVDVTAERTVLHLDVRHGGRDTIAVVVLTGPLDCAPTTVRPDGLALTGNPTVAATADDVTVTVPLSGGTWTIRAAAGSWYID